MIGLARGPLHRPYSIPGFGQNERPCVGPSYIILSLDSCVQANDFYLFNPKIHPGPLLHLKK